MADKGLEALRKDARELAALADDPDDMKLCAGALRFAVQGIDAIAGALNVEQQDAWKQVRAAIVQ